MKLSRASGHAVQALVSMAGRDSKGGEGQLVASHLTAGDAGVPEAFLLKVLRALVSAGILLSMRGPNGGYRLARPAAKITLLEVIEAVDGPLWGDARVFGGEGTEALDSQLVEVCQRVTDQTRKLLGKVRISTLAAGPR